ncbi:hypothetical protein BDZ97DRAFT_1915516 [Flammula alnicola]|nr:hypothetical protein BDZ97DRAFT_1915516 [Flammula alnicola]
MQFSAAALFVVLAATASSVMGLAAVAPAADVFAREAVQAREVHGYLDINLKL